MVAHVAGMSGNPVNCQPGHTSALLPATLPGHWGINGRRCRAMFHARTFLQTIARGMAVKRIFTADINFAFVFRQFRAVV